MRRAPLLLLLPALLLAAPLVAQRDGVRPEAPAPVAAELDAYYRHLERAWREARPAMALTLLRDPSVRVAGGGVFAPWGRLRDLLATTMRTPSALTFRVTERRVPAPDLVVDAGTYATDGTVRGSFLFVWHRAPDGDFYLLAESYTALP